LPLLSALTITIAADTNVDVRNKSGCCQDESRTFKPGEASVILTTSFLPAQLEFECAIPDTRVLVDGESKRIDKATTITFENATQPTKAVKVEFLGEKVDPTPKLVPLTANKTAKVKCDPR